MTCVGITGEFSKSQFEWEISNFFALTAEKGSFYKSPSFVFDNASFCMIICPEGDFETKTGSISLYLINESDCPVHVDREFHIKKADGTLTASFRSTTAALIPSEGKGLPSIIDLNPSIIDNRSDLLKDKSELVSSDTLTIVCVLKLVKNRKKVSVKADDVKALDQEQTQKSLDYKRLTDLDALSENLKNLSANKDSCDVVLQVEEHKEFKAHKAILMARSPVFAAMFQHDTLEKEKGFVNIPDCDSESFQEFLDFLYCGKLEDVSFRSAFNLYSTAHKYEVLKLKEFCTKYLIESLTINNICDIVELAEKYDETMLITEAQSFFIENLCEILLTSEWSKLLTNNLRLAQKLLTEYATAKRSQ